MGTKIIDQQILDYYICEICGCLARYDGIERKCKKCGTNYIRKYRQSDLDKDRQSSQKILALCYGEYNNIYEKLKEINDSGVKPNIIVERK